MKRNISVFALLLGGLAAFGPSASAYDFEDIMRLTPAGYRIGATGAVKPCDPSVVTVTPGDTSIVTSNKPVTLTAVLNRDYRMIRWQKFDVDPTVRTEADPIEEFGEGRETVSVGLSAGVQWMYVTVVLGYDPVRTVKASVSTFGRGTVSVSPEKESYRKGDVVTLTAQPAEGHAFVRWSDGVGDHVRTVTVDDDVDLTAYIEPISSTVTFAAESNAVLGVTSKRVSYGCEYGELPVPVRDGRVFTGWADADGNAVTAKTAVDRSSDHALYAQWEIPPASYTVVFEPNGGTGDPIEQTFEVGVAQKLRINTFYYPGHVFVGWNQDAQAEEKQFSDEQLVSDLAAAGGTVTLFAVWRAEKVAYTVHFDKNAEDATGTMNDQQFAGGEAKPLSGCNFKRTGWAFLGWSTDKDALEADYQDRENVQDLTTQKELTLYAVWTKNPVYYIEYKNGDDLWKSETVEQGKEYKLVRYDGPVQTGKSCLGWKIGDKKYASEELLTAQDLRKLAGDGDTIIFDADMQWITYTIAFDGNGGECHAPNVPGVRYGEERPLKFAQGDFSKKDSVFVGLGRDRKDALYVMPAGTGIVDWQPVVSNLTTVANDTVTLYAIWESKSPEPVMHTVTFMTNDVPYATTNVVDGGLVERPPEPKRDGYAFTGWTNETYTAPFDFNTQITADLTLYAAWKKSEISLKEALGFDAGDPIEVTADTEKCWEDAGDNTINLTKYCEITFKVSGTISVGVWGKGESREWLQYKVDDKTSYQYKSDDFEEIVNTIENGKSLTIWKSADSVINSLKCSRGQ